MVPDTRKASKHIELPECVWERIAGAMSLKDWAMASGTCKATAEVRLPIMNITAWNISRSGIAWASKRMRDTRVLRLRADAAQELANNISSGCPDLPSLQQLEIYARAAGSAPLGFPMWLTWLLANAQQLNTLLLQTSKMPWLPPLRNLKHLVVRFGTEAGRIISAVTNARALETLCLVYQPQTDEDDSESFSSCQALQLGKLVHLHSLALTGIRPSKVDLPQGCSLSLCNMQEFEMIGDAWDNVVGRVRSLTFFWESSCFAHVPSFFTRFSQLSNVSLTLNKVGAANAPLALACLANVKRLIIQASELYISMPSAFSWHGAYFFSSTFVLIEFADMAAFAKRVTATDFYVIYDSVKGPWLPRLCAALGAQGVVWSVLESNESDNRTQFACACDENDYCTEACWCDACLECLARSGVAEALNANSCCS